MADIETIWTGVRGDWALAGPDLASGDDLASAVLISLFTERASPDGAPPNDGSDDPRGWWGDEGESAPIGSQLWRRLRSKRTDATLQLVTDDILEATRWLVDDKVATSVSATAEWRRRDERWMLAVSLTIERGTGQPAALQYAWAWEGV